MKDWRALANAAGLAISNPEMDCLFDSLNALEEAFRPLVKDLSPDLEPAIVYIAEEAE